MPKMGHFGTAVPLLLLLTVLRCCVPQKPNTDNRRHDVYIAGFFPFGRGVENSDTGTVSSSNSKSYNHEVQNELTMVFPVKVSLMKLKNCTPDFAGLVF